jgi:cytochrome P450
MPMVATAEAVPWTRAIIDESLRLYPPAWVVSRRSSRADVLSGRVVPAGTTATTTSTDGSRQSRTALRRFVATGRGSPAA